jgi:hypothetical protein
MLMSTTRPWVMTEKNHTQKKSNSFSTDVDVSDYGESKSAIKKIFRKKNLGPLSGRDNLFFYHIYIYIYIYIVYIYIYIYMYVLYR